MRKNGEHRKRIYYGLCFITVGICLASWGWLYSVESATPDEVVISTPIKVTPLEESFSETSEEGISTQIRVANHTSTPVRVVGFAARCVCIERLFDLPRDLAPGDELTLDVNIYLPLPEGGTPAILFVEQDQTVWKRKVYFMQ